MFSENDYKEYLLHKKLNERTIGAYIRDAQHFCDEADELNVSGLDAVTEEIIDGYCKRRIKEGMAVVSVQRKLASLKKLFEYMQHIGQADCNPADGVKLKAGEKAARRVLTKSEINRLLAQPQKCTPGAIRDCAMFELMLSTGIKVTELINLEAEGAVADSQKILIVRDGEVMDMYLDDKAHKCLWRYLTSAREVLLAGNTESALFLNARGHRLSRQGFWKILRKRADAMNLGHVTPETLRRTFAYHFAGAGHDIYCLNKVLGHSSVAITKAYIKERVEPK